MYEDAIFLKSFPRRVLLLVASMKTARDVVFVSTPIVIAIINIVYFDKKKMLFEEKILIELALFPGRRKAKSFPFECFVPYVLMCLIIYRNSTR